MRLPVVVVSDVRSWVRAAPSTLEIHYWNELRYRFVPYFIHSGGNQNPGATSQPVPQLLLHLSRLECATTTAWCQDRLCPMRTWLTIGAWSVVGETDIQLCELIPLFVNHQRDLSCHFPRSGTNPCPKHQDTKTRRPQPITAHARVA